MALFKKNLGTSGKILRGILALLLFAYAFWAKSWIALIFAIFTLFEAFMSWCILYQLMGKNSCPIDRND
jgi:Protein of unknown function (DUF2892).